MRTVTLNLPIVWIVLRVTMYITYLKYEYEISICVIFLILIVNLKPCRLMLSISSQNKFIKAIFH